MNLNSVWQMNVLPDGGFFTEPEGTRPDGGAFFNFEACIFPQGNPARVEPTWVLGGLALVPTEHGFDALLGSRTDHFVVGSESWQGGSWSARCDYVGPFAAVGGTLPRLPVSTIDRVTWWARAVKLTSMGTSSPSDLVWWNASSRDGGIVRIGETIDDLRVIDADSVAILVFRADAGSSVRRVALDGGQTALSNASNAPSRCLFGDSIADFWCIDSRIAWGAALDRVLPDAGRLRVFDGGANIERVIGTAPSLLVFRHETAELDAGFEGLVMRSNWSAPARLFTTSDRSAFAIGERADGGIVFGYWESEAVSPRQPLMLPPLVTGEFCPP